MKWPKLKRDRIGMKVKTRYPLTTPLCELPAGSTVTIVGWHRGAVIESEPCPHCKVQVKMRKVQEFILEPSGA